MPHETPSFGSFPLKKDGPRGNTWGLFGDNDELGMLNRLTPANTIAATKEIVHGIRICTDWGMNQLEVPGFGRVKFEHKIVHKSPRFVNDDIITLNTSTQGSSQWDRFKHYVWVGNGGVVGQGRSPALLETTSITVSDLDAIAASQGVTFQPGDILFIHSGYVKALESLKGDDVINYATSSPKAIGVKSGEEILRWIWEKLFSAVAADMLAFEALPFQNNFYWLLHEWLLAGWGMPIGELFDLEKLAAECSGLNKWSFFFSSVPSRVPGGVASPPNGVAILQCFLKVEAR